MLNNPKEIIIHCAATPDDGDSFGAADIDRWHDARGWAGIGYHWVIRRSGVLEEGRPEDKVPASVYRHNTDTLAICLMGTKRYEDEQYEALAKLLRTKLREYNLTEKDIKGHYELASKDCPGIDMTLLRRWIKLELG